MELFHLGFEPVQQPRKHEADKKGGGEITEGAVSHLGFEPVKEPGKQVLEVGGSHSS